MKKILKIDVKKSPKKINQFCEMHDLWILELDRKMKSKDIEKIYNKHIKSPYCCTDLISLIAGHQNTPINILKILAKIASDNILLSLALNPKITDEIAENIIKTTNNYSVLEHLFSNPKISVYILRKNYKNIKDTDLKKLIAKKLKTNQKAVVG